MIILKHLTVEYFRLLRRVDLHFPQRGSILIQGPNEAGKSTLFESIYFALYGEPLSVDPNGQGNPNLDDLISYGEKMAVVTLVIAIGATELAITRTIERGQGQRASLVVHRLGLPEEQPVTSLPVVNQRVVRELGYLDGEALRNAGLIEQKGLGRLERLSGTERESTLRRLLGLEKFTRLKEQFHITPADEKLLTECTEQLKLAELQARIPDVSAQLGATEEALDAVAVAEQLADVDRQEEEIAEQHLSLEQLEERRSELKSRQNRVKQLKRANETLGQIISAYDAMAEAQREMPELERQITELERREREELPALEQRVRELSELSKSFGTLEHMAADLLTAVNTIKELEQEAREFERMQETLNDLDAQIEHAQLLVDEAVQAQNEVEEQNRSGRPKLEARVLRLKALIEKLESLHQAEEQHTQAVAQNKLAEENSIALRKVWRDLQEAEQELEQIEKETRQVQQRAEEVEQRWRKINIRRQLVDWQRLKGLSQGLADAERRLQETHLQQEKLNIAQEEARSRKNTAMFTLVGVSVASVIFLIVALLSFFSGALFVFGGAFLLFCLLVFATFWGVGRWRNVRDIYNEAYAAMQEGVNSVSLMVAARQAAVRMGGDHEALAQVEREIVALGGSLPPSVEAAQQFLESQPVVEESIVALQQELNGSRDEAQAARNRVNAAQGTVTRLRNEYTRLQDQRKQEDWDVLDEKQRAIQDRIDQLRAEVATAAGQEGLPLLLGEAGARTTSPDHVTSEAELKVHIHDALRATEREIAILAGKMDVIPDLEAQVKIHRDALEILVTRKKNLVERYEEFQASYPAQRIERAREQQTTLRDALRSLQDTLRLRVQPLGVSFGQTSITTAEGAARKQLEALHIALGTKESLQERLRAYADVLRDQQEALSEHYRQLAKFSGTLGSWIVPPKPFAEVLVSLRVRCEREMEEANESGIQGEFDNLKLQEGALRARIALCMQEIEEIQERIATLLTQRNRSTPRSYLRSEVVAVWPLVGEQTPQKRAQVETQLAELADELHRLEEEELALSQQLQTGGRKLDLAEARQRMEEQERTYTIKKHGSRMLKAAEERLMRKTLPRVEFYLQQLLPLLTVGRYHDLRLSTSEDETCASGGQLQLSVWEPAASMYIARSSLSGGTADQVSLALRLAFAIAALPRELGAAPGFVLLDEPLTSSSRERMRALADIVTGDMLGQHFEQIFFISHSSAFDPTLFSYQVYVEDGLITESTLPVALDDSAALTRNTPLPESSISEVFEIDDEDLDDLSAVKVASRLPLTSE